MKLTKTQTRLLLEAAADRSGVVVTMLVGGHGSHGGLLRGGYRESDAACGLRDKGLLTFVKQVKSTDACRGWQKHFTDTIWEITEAGRALAQTLVGGGK